MNVYHYPCGEPIERLFSFLPLHSTYSNALGEDLRNCPQCDEILCDTDLRDADGEWLLIYQQSPWSLARRAAWDKARIAQ